MTHIEKPLEKAEKEVKKEVKKVWNILRPRLLIGGALLLIILLIFLFAGFKIRFFISEELKLEVQPASASLQSHREDVPLSFKITPDTFFECSAVCTYTLTDISTNRVVSSKTKSFSYKEEDTASYLLTSPKNGTGQVLYSLDISCSNKKTSLCLTNSLPVSKTVLITLNYNLTDQEKELESSLLFDLDSLQKEVALVRSDHDQIRTLLSRLPTRLEETIELKNELENMTAQLLHVEDATNTTIQLYRTQRMDYAKTILSKQLQTTSQALIDKSPALLDNSRSLIDRYNTLALQLQNIPLEEIHNATIYYLAQSTPLHEQLLSSILNTCDSLYHYIEFMTHNAPYSLETMEVATNSSVQEVMQEQEIYTQIINRGHVLFDGAFNCELQNATLQIVQTNLSNETEQISVPINYTLEQQEYFNAHCGTASSQNISIIDELRHVEKPIFINQTTEQTYVEPLPLTPNPALCCYKNSCEVCGSKKHIPILFIHGHSFNEKNTPEASLATFAIIQKNLSEIGFVNAGDLDITSTNDAEWSKIVAPLILSSSYYYISHLDLGVYELTTQKSERIENYALRLKDIIDLLKKQTGSDKVIIVAHSMGGLVARDYMDLFGSESVEKLITINTPHQGVSARVANLCGILGSQKECQDMEEGSVFLQRLNSKPTPKNIIVIRSTGCTMKEGKGDGIVTETQGKLTGAEKDYLIQGHCTDSLQTDLHTNLLDPKLYPDVYELLVNLLMT